MPTIETSLDEIIEITPDHWAAVGNGLYWVRDVVMVEDSSPTRQFGALQMLQMWAAFPNITISLVQLSGFDSVVESIGAFSAGPNKALNIMSP